MMNFSADNDWRFHISTVVATDKRGVVALKFDEFRDAIPVMVDDRDEHQLWCRLQPCHEFLDKGENHKQIKEVDSVMKATYTHLLTRSVCVLSIFCFLLISFSLSELSLFVRNLLPIFVMVRFQIYVFSPLFSWRSVCDLPFLFVIF